MALKDYKSWTDYKEKNKRVDRPASGSNVSDNSLSRYGNWEAFKNAQRQGLLADTVKKTGVSGIAADEIRANKAGNIGARLDARIASSRIRPEMNEAAAAAYRKFKGEDAPASSLRVGAGEAASGSMKKIGPGEYSQLRTKRIGAGEEMVRDTQIGRKKAEDVRTYADDLHNRFGRELADVTPEIFEQRPEEKSIGGIIQNVPGLNVDLEIASRYGIDPQKFGGITKEAAPGKRIGAGEVALTDPQYIGYENLKMQPDFAQYAAKGKTGRPEEAEAENAQGLLWEIFTNPAGIRDSIETSYMTREEEQNYDYLLGKYGAEEAERYYRSIEDAINQRKGVAQYENTQTLPGWAKTAYEASMPVTSGLDQTISGVAALGDVLMGDRQARGVSPSLYADALLRERLNAESGWKIPFTDVGWKQALHDAVQTTAAQIPQYAMNLATGGGMSGWAVLYASAFGNAYSEKRREGASFGQSVATGIESALVEGLSEKIGGFAMGRDATLVRKLFGNKLDNISSPILKALTETGLDAAGEGLEEVIAEVAAPIAEEYIMSDAEDERTFVDKLVDGLKAIKRSDLVYAGALGAATGGAMTGPVNVVNAISEARTKAAQASAQSVKSKETTPEQKHNAAKKALEIADVENAEELADAVVKMANGEELTQDEMQAVATTEGALEVVKEIAGTEVNQKAADDTVETADAVAEENASDWEEAPEELDGAEQDAWYNRQRAVSAAAKLGGERRIHEEIYDMGGGQQDAVAYAIEFERAYNRGANNLKLTDEIAASYTTLNPDQAQAAWNEGRKAYETTIAKAPERSKVSMNGNVGSVDATALKGLKLNTNQRAAIRASQTIAEALGIKVVWEASEANEQGKRESMNGWYLPKDQSIHLDIYAGSVDATQSAAFQYATMRTFSHELTHYIQDQSPAQYAQLRDMVFGYLQEQGMDVEALIEEKAKNYSKVNGYTRFDVTQEVIADACEMMLRDSTAVETVMKKDPSLWERIKEKFAEFVEDLRAAFGRVDKLHPEARALMREAEGVLKYAEDLQRKWDEALLSTRQTQETADETEQTASETEQKTPEAEQDKVGSEREGITLMEDRNWESIKDRSMRPFAEDVPEVREWFAMAAELLRDDLAASTPGQKMYIPVQGNEPGTINVTGQKRSTVDEIADLLDHGMTYRNISDALDAYAQIDMGWIGKHPQTAKKVELTLDQVLLNGYTNIEGERVPGVEDYKALMDELAGREAKEPVEYDLGEDMVFSRRDTSLDLSDMRRYSLREHRIIEGYLEAVDPEIEQMVNDVERGNALDKRYLTFGEADGRTVDVIREDAGIDVSGYKYSLDESGIRHIFKRHGKNGANDQTMRENKDIARMRFVIENADEFGRLIDNRTGKPAVSRHHTKLDGEGAPQYVYSKKIDDYYYVVISALESKRKTLRVSSAYMSKSGKVMELSRPHHADRNKGADPQLTSETKIMHGSDSSIAEAPEPVNEDIRYSLREPVADNVAFQKWFGESKVVNADGTPMVVYHGTDAYDQINVFKRGKKGWLGPGIYLAQDKNDAQHYADKSGYGGRVYELYARVENPLVVTQSNPVPEILQAAYNRSSIYEKRSAKQANDVSILTPADIKKLQEKGYDGIIWKFGKRPWEINVFSPEQLKSATDNTGAYSRESKDIRYQERDETYVSNRELLANALEGAAQTVAEKNKIAEYKRRVRSLDIAENRAAFVREEMAEINRDLKDKDLRDSEKAELNERLETLREQRDRLDREINEADKVLLKLEATEPLQKVVNRERKAAMDRVRAKANERRDVDKYKQRIANKVASLTVLLTRPSTKKYLPDPIRGPVAEFLSSISFVSKRQLQGGKPTQKDMKFAESLAALQRVMSKVRERYNDAETSEVVQEGFGGYLDLPEGFVKSLTTLSEKVEQDAKRSEEGYNVNMMSIAQLESLDEIITTLKKSIENVNKFLGENLYKHVDQAARDTFVDLGDMKNRTRTTDAGEFFEWENAMPAYAFDRFGRGGKAVFNGLVHGQGKLGMNAKQVIDFANDTYTAEEARKWAEDIKTFRFGDNELKIPVTHIMSLYCLRKREQAQGHLQGEGIRVADFEYKGRKYKDPGRTVDDRMLDEIVSALSDRQKAVADKLQAYMVEVGSEWGNEVSMRRFGYRAFEEKNYFPINSDGNHLAAVSEEGGKGNAMYALLNISPTKELTPKANNRLMLYNIFDVFANHMSDMAQYNAMALPLMDAIKWINYKESTKLPGSDARHTRSMQDAINMAYGEPARRYVIRMLEDVSGRKATVSEDKMTGKMLGRVNRAAVAANLRVALLQPLSLIRAGMDMNAVPIVMGFARNPVHLRENIEKMQKYSGIAVWKDLGFRELNISRGLKKLIKHDETVMENIVDKSMILAEAADKFTWAAMWEAAEIQTEKTMSRSDEGFYTAVRDLFERTVYRTQVVDSVLTKSQYMRTPAGMNKLFSSFMSEPVTTYNMLADMVWKISDESRRLAAKDIAENGQPKNKAEAAQRAAKYVRGATKVNAKLVGRTFAVYGASVVATTLLEAVMTAWRDDDDYEKFMDKLKETTIWDWIDNMNPLAMVPVGSQLWDLFKMALNKLGSDAYGFEMTLPMTDIFNTATELYDMWSKWSQGKGSATGYGVAYKGTQLVSDVVGLPFASFAREGISLWNNAVASFVPELRVTTYATPDVNGASAYLRAVRENDDRLAAEMMAELEANNVTGRALLDAMEDAIKAAYKSGGMDKDEAARLLEKYAGYENEKEDKYAAERLVREWEVKGESGENSQYAWVWKHISDWDGKALKAEIKELKALGVKETSIRTSVTNHFKDEYLQATGREKTDLKAHLITALTMLGMSSAEAKKKIESWKEE